MRTTSPPRAGTIALTPTPAKTAPMIGRQRTGSFGYAAWMMLRHARLTASSRRMWNETPRSSAPQPRLSSLPQKTSIAFQIGSIRRQHRRYAAGGPQAFTDCRRRRPRQAA
jgi:hypothetical protein